MAKNTSSPSSASPLRKPAVAAARGAVLAMHAAAGLAATVNREAARLLRASEGLARAATALLECTGWQEPPEKISKEEKENIFVGEKYKVKNSKKACTVKGKGKGKGNGVKVGAMSVDEIGLAVAVAPLRVGAETFVPRGESELADEWADGHVVQGPLNLPHVRQLRARRSGSRSPRGSLVVQPSPIASPLVAGHLAAINELSSRPELAGEPIRLVEFDDAAGRWRCALRNGEFLRIHTSKIQSINAAFQDSMELKFKKLAQ
jgi:hypothetical protein